jgi:hypothetical protein
MAYSLGADEASTVETEQRRWRSAPVIPDRLVLDDGRSVCIRHLRPADRAMYRNAVEGLSARSRYLRFAAPTLMKIGRALNR